MLAALAALFATPLFAQTTDVDRLITDSCATCHTQTGNSLAPPFPKLAGLSAEYLAKQLRDVRSGARKSEIMQPILGDLSRGEIQAIANYFSRQQRTPGIVTNPKLIAAGERVYLEGNKENGVPACAGCHTKTGAGAPRFPMIAAQNAEYVIQQLRNFRSGERTNDFGMLMRTTVSRLTDDEIQAVAQYVASMPVPPVGR
ncbi:cytochrome c553 [Thiocystis violascens DSM 198]|uniref:Cytochrome c553 n=1 Tax=Thiocystis violascens (strain ATCC 17096 / DSM 198 / 6111) TaxID=765911 RepID=I3YEE1_THIV6|nr:cytochrome c553 [Thiocystis violascens DSM 198]